MERDAEAMMVHQPSQRHWFDCVNKLEKEIYIINSQMRTR